LDNKRISIFIGCFGSGKTEISINYSLKLKETNEKVVIVDLDIINPYFRTNDARRYLEKSGIRVIAPLYANTNVDVPALTGEINMIFDNKDYKAVIDVGGDDLGAKVLARYKRDIDKAGYNLYFVINTRRPMTSFIDELYEEYMEISRSSKLEVTGLINNTNILGETNLDILLEGQEIISKFAERVNKKILYTTILDGIDFDIKMLNSEILTLDKFIRLPWE